MLMEVLTEFVSGNSRRVSEIANRLGTSKAMVEQALFDLVSRGYLEQKHEMTHHCGACGKGADEPMDCQIKQWVLTEKGQEAVNRHKAKQS